jgi:hypothetical protein
MRLKIDIEIPQWTRWLVGGIAVGLALGLGAWRVYAAVSVKTNWQPGDALKAADINSNFQTLQDAINTINTSIAPGAKVYAMTNGKKYSINATYCGATLATNGAISQGGLVGYAAAKAACETTCGSSSAHMCSGEEIVRHVSMGGTIPTGQGWIAAAASVNDSYPVQTDGTKVSCTSDCLGFEASTNIACSAAGLSFGTVWQGSWFTQLGCDQTAPIYCCD